MVCIITFSHYLLTQSHYLCLEILPIEKTFLTLFSQMLSLCKYDLARHCFQSVELDSFYIFREDPISLHTDVGVLHRASTVGVPALADLIRPQIK